MGQALEIETHGSRAWIKRGGVEIWGPGRIELAERKVEELERAEKRTRRNCMCCGTPFMSEGIHNRLCATCRGVGASAEDVAV